MCRTFVSVTLILAFVVLSNNIGCKRPAGGSGQVADVPLSQIGLTKDGWFQVYDQAVAKAKETGKPILVDFTGSDWCIWCQRLDAEVFAHDAFTTWAKEHVVLLKLDYPRGVAQPPSLKRQNQELLQKYRDQVPGYPTILFIKADGSVVGNYGYDEGGPEVWTQKASAKLSGT